MAASLSQAIPKFHALRRQLDQAAIRPLAVALFSLAFAYRGGFWLVYIHEVAGATEVNEPPLVLHWLRDSTLMLPLVLIAVYAGLLLARWLARRLAPRGSRLAAGLVTIVALAILTSVVVTLASPLHDLIFQASEPLEAHSHSIVSSVYSLEHLIQDGLLALAADVVIAALVLFILDGKAWLDRPAKHLPTSPAAERTGPDGPQHP